MPAHRRRRLCMAQTGWAGPLACRARPLHRPPRNRWTAPATLNDRRAGDEVRGVGDSAAIGERGHPPLGRGNRRARRGKNVNCGKPPETSRGSPPRPPESRPALPHSFLLVKFDLRFSRPLAVAAKNPFVAHERLVLPKLQGGAKRQQIIFFADFHHAIVE